MQRVNQQWYECEDGHITVAKFKEEREKCEAVGWLHKYVKGKKKAEWVEEISKEEKKKCGKKIVDTGEIPIELNLFEVWDPRIMLAFTIGNSIDHFFICDLQKAFSKKDK